MVPQQAIAIQSNGVRILLDEGPHIEITRHNLVIAFFNRNQIPLLYFSHLL
jgi:hypothetical protein